jgi:hypothetical protein
MITKTAGAQKRCDNANSALNLDEIVGLGRQQTPNKQVTKGRENKETAAIVVTLYTGFP